MLSGGTEMSGTDRKPPKISVEFAEYEPIPMNNFRFDRAATTLGFDKRTPRSASCTQRPLTQSNVLRNTTTGRAITAPLVSNRSFTPDSLETVTAVRGRHIPDCRERYPEKITPDILIKLLTDRGFGTPRMCRYPPLPPEHVIDKHYAERRKVSYYMEKLRGHSRMDCDIANARAMAFCEEQREASHARMRTGSALYRMRHRRDFLLTINDDERSFVGSQTNCSRDETGIGSDKSDDKNARLLERVNTWIDGCDQANAKGFRELQNVTKIS